MHRIEKTVVSAPTNGDLWGLLAARRHVGLRRLVAPGPDDAALARILGAAAQAPDHGLLRPWRFVQIGRASCRERV